MKEFVPEESKAEKHEKEQEVEKDLSDKVSSEAKQVVGQTESIFSPEPEVPMTTAPVEEISLINVCYSRIWRQMK